MGCRGRRHGSRHRHGRCGRIGGDEGTLVFGKHLLPAGERTHQELEILLVFRAQVQKSQAHAYRVVRGFHHGASVDIEVVGTDVKADHAAFGKSGGSFDVTAGQAHVAQVTPGRWSAILLAKFYPAAARITRMSPPAGWHISPRW